MLQRRAEKQGGTGHGSRIIIRFCFQRKKNGMICWVRMIQERGKNEWYRKESTESYQEGFELSKQKWKCCLWTPTRPGLRGCKGWWVAGTGGFPSGFNFLSQVKHQVISLVESGEPVRHHESQSPGSHRSQTSIFQQDCLRAKGVTEDYLEINGTSVT